MVNFRGLGDVKYDMAGKINLVCLIAAILIVFIFPLKKEIWYDETISVLCSKGITHDSPTDFASATVINSSALAALNTAGNVYKATQVDNGNSYVYNTGLHWFTQIFGNNINTYILFSKLSSIAALMAFFVLCNLFLKNSIFTGVAILLLAVNINFAGMAHEIRAYSMGTFFVIVAGIYFYRFMYKEEKPLYLFLTGLFSVAAVLCHFLSAYVILVFIAYIVFTKKARLLTLKNITALLIPTAIIGIYIYLSLFGFKAMGQQNAAIEQRELSQGFSAIVVLLRSLNIAASDFTVTLPAFIANKAITILSFLWVIALYAGGLKFADNKEDKRNLTLLFILGISGTVFLGLLALKSHHYTSLYYRYHSFCQPFSTLLPVYALYIFSTSKRIQPMISKVLTGIVILPACMLFVVSIKNNKPVRNYNHVVVAGDIIRGNVSRVEVPDWKEAFLVNSFLPQGYKIDYVLNKTSPYFTLYKANYEKVLIKVIRFDR